MAHKFEPADAKYWADQKIKREQAILRQKMIAASKTNFKQLFVEEDDVKANHTVKARIG
jgi:hypothetical protein